MTVIFITGNNCRCCAIAIQNNGFIRERQFEDVSESDKNFIYSISSVETFLGESQSCTMTDL